MALTSLSWGLHLQPWLALISAISPEECLMLWIGVASGFLVSEDKLLLKSGISLVYSCVCIRL